MKRSLWLFAAVALFLTLGGCVLPDYFLEFYLADPYETTTSGTVAVNFHMENTGSKDMEKATLTIKFLADNGAGTTYQDNGMTASYDLAVGQSVDSTVSIPLASIDLDPGYTLRAEVIEVGFNPAE